MRNIRWVGRVISGRRAKDNGTAPARSARVPAKAPRLGPFRADVQECLFVRFVPWAAAAAALIAAVLPLSAGAEDRAVANFFDRKGQAVGQAQLMETAHGVLIRVILVNMAPGIHGFHIYETGKCDAPSFEGAGGIFNPFGATHGIQSPDGKMAGDLPNIFVDQNGALTFEVVADEVTLGTDSEGLLFDTDGSALIVHQDGDDYKSQPDGRTGERIACAVIQR